MELPVQHFETYSLARPSATRLDAAGAPALKSAVADLANQGRHRLVLDLAGLEFVDSSGLGALIHIHKTLGRQGRLVLCNVDPKVAQLFKITRLERVFNIAAGVDDAAAQMKA